MPDPCANDCANCVNIIPKQLLLSISNITNHTCSQCTLLNGTWTLDDGGGCFWSTYSDHICTSTFANLGLVGGTTFGRYLAAGVDAAHYLGPAALRQRFVHDSMLTQTESLREFCPGTE